MDGVRLSGGTSDVFRQLVDHLEKEVGADEYWRLCRKIDEMGDAVARIANEDGFLIHVFGAFMATAFESVSRQNEKALTSEELQALERFVSIAKLYAATRTEDRREVFEAVRVVCEAHGGMVVDMKGAASA